jgi:hypothetical protein
MSRLGDSWQQMLLTDKLRQLHHRLMLSLELLLGKQQLEQLNVV